MTRVATEYIRAEFRHAELYMVAILAGRGDTKVYVISNDGPEVFMGYAENLCPIVCEKADRAILNEERRRKALRDASRAARAARAA